MQSQFSYTRRLLKKVSGETSTELIADLDQLVSKKLKPKSLAIYIQNADRTVDTVGFDPGNWLYFKRLRGVTGGEGDRREPVSLRLQVSHIVR